MPVPDSVTIVEVAPRDGLQNEAKTLSPQTRIEFIRQLATTGLNTIEATSFVSPKVIPQLIDSGEVFAGIKDIPDINFPVLVPNEKGMESAIVAGAKIVAVITAVSDSFCQRNTNCTILESMQRIENIIRLAKQNNIKVRGYISCALGCPYEGDMAPSKSADLARDLFAMGCYQISLGDTIGVGTPLAAKRLVDAVGKYVPINSIAGHFHDTYGQALANIYAVLEQGVRVFDSSTAGLGGCPYAKGSSGNVATEDVVYMLNGMNISTGIDLERLLQVSMFISEQLGKKPTSRVALACNY